LTTGKQFNNTPVVEHAYSFEIVLRCL